MTSNSKQQVRAASGRGESPDLAYLNRNYGYPAQLTGPSAADSLSAKFLRRLSSALQRLLGSYFAAETEFNAATVRCLNELSQCVDSRQAELDDQYRATLNDLERRIGERQQQELQQLSARIAALETSVSGAQAQLAVLDSVSRGLEQIVARISRGGGGHSGEDAAAPASPPADVSYLLLENRYRGSEEEIARRLSDYVEVLRPRLPQLAGKPLLEVGAGRGELQHLLRDAGIASYGLELDRAMAEHCGAHGFDVRLEDGIAHLRGLADAGLAGVAAIQVVEHLPIETLREFLRLCRRRIAPGGIALFETINTGSIVALSQNYFRDPTHTQPLHPDTMRLLVEQAGMSVREVKMRSPFPPQVLLQHIPPAEYLTPRWQALLESVNDNIDRLNRLLFGWQDYCLIAEVPTEA